MSGGRDSTTARTRRRLGLAAGIVLAVLAARLVPRALERHHLRRLGGERFLGALERLERRSRDLARRAQDFDGERALRSLPPNPASGFQFRFDDHLADARYEGPSSSERDASALPRLAFDDPARPGLVDPRADARVLGGRLVLRADPSTPLVTPEGFALDPARVGRLHLRMRAARGREARLRWFDERELLGELALPLVPGGELHTYDVDAMSLLRDARTFDARGSRRTIRRLELVPSDVAGDEVELVSLRFLGRAEALRARCPGRAHVDLGGELRASLCLRPGSALTFEVDVPGEPLHFRAGAGVLGAPAELVLRGEPGGRELLRRRIAPDDRWQELELALDAATARRLTLAVEGQAGSVALWSNPRLEGTPREPRRVILVLEDALRADRLPSYGAERDTAPFKRELFARGVLFEHALSTATKTRPSCPSMMCSLPPSATGVWNFGDVLGEGFVTLAEVLRRQGFATAAFVQNPNAGPAAGLHQGFSTVFDKEASGMRTPELFGARLDGWLAAHAERSFFLYLHLVDPHGPYDPPAPFDRAYRDDPPPADAGLERAYLDPPWVEAVSREGRRRLYDGEIEHNDRALRGFVERLEAMGLLEDTLLVFLSDHGEFLGEHGLWEHHPPGHREVLHVPLALVAPGRLPAGRRVAQNVGLMDVAPTVLEWCDVDASGLLLFGDSLLPLARGEETAWPERVVLSEEVVQRAHKEDLRPAASLFFGPWHLLRSPALATPRGPRLVQGLRVLERGKGEGWSTFVLDRRLEERVDAALRRLATQHALLWRTLRGSDTAGGETLLDAQHLERLRALGYLGSAAEGSAPASSPGASDESK